MRRLLLPILLFVFASLPATALANEPTVEFDRIRASYRTDGSFKRISEFFTGKEVTGKRLLYRTDASDRNGFYFAFRLEVPKKEMLPAGSIVVRYFAPGVFEPLEITYPVDALDKQRVDVLIGLTGSSWPDPDARPTAWKLVFLDASGKPLGSAQSFLWELPDEETQ